MVEGARRDVDPSLRDEAAVQAVAQELTEATGIACRGIACDVTQADQVAALISAVLDAFGRIDLDGAQIEIYANGSSTPSATR